MNTVKQVSYSQVGLYRKSKATLPLYYKRESSKVTDSTVCIAWLTCVSACVCVCVCFRDKKTYSKIERKYG